MKASYKYILTLTVVVDWYLSGKAKCLVSMFTQIMASSPPLSHKKNSLINQMVSGIIKNLHTVYPIWVKCRQ